MKVKQEVKFREILPFIMRWIDVYSVFNKPYDEWLAKRKKDFFAISVYLYNKGFDLEQRGIGKLYKEYGNFGSKNGEVTNYRRWLKEDGWLIQTRTGLTIPEAFKNIGEDITVFYNQRLENGVQEADYQVRGGVEQEKH